MFQRLPIARKLLVIVGVFVAIVICVSYLSALRSDILTGVRAYVGGESMWSKAEKRAVFSLTRYAESHNESDYQQYVAEIAVSEGDSLARRQLSSPSPDMALVRRGFVQGRNHPDDVKSLAMLFRRFGRIGYMARAIAIWTEADEQIEQLRSVGVELHREVNSAHPDAQKIRNLADQAAAVDARLTPLEDAFSSTLGEGARWIDRMLALVSLATSGLLLLIGIAFSTAVLKQIRNSEEKYRNLINTASDAILVVDAETRRVLEANNRACEMLRLTDRQLVGMLESQLYPQPAEGSAPLLALDKAGSARGRELDLLRADGIQVPVEVSASATELGGRPAVLGIFRDIRERRQAAAVLRRSEERFRYLIQNLSDVITIVAVDGTMLYHSPSIEPVAGYRPSELLGNSFLSFIHPEDVSAVRAALERLVLHPGSASPPEFRFRHKNGSWVWLESVGNNLLNDAAVGGIVVTSRDVTTRRGLEDQVRQSQKMEALGRLAGGIAHDFNNLLMVIRGYAEIVLQPEQAPASVRNSVETIVRTTESAAKLTRQLLSFSRKHVFSVQTLEMNALVNQMSAMLRGLLGEEMEFIVKLEPGAGWFSADPGQIEQVVMNLVVNARDAMPRGGKLTLETARWTVAPGGDSANLPAGEYVLLTVSDTGVGMDAGTQSRIFEPFFTTKSKEKGTGLGLSVVYNIVRGSGGHVLVTSEPHRGASFQIFFPRVDAPVPPPIEVPAEVSQPGKETILVAEDQPDLRWMVCQFLQDRGYSVLEARDGSEAVTLAEQYDGTIDLLLSDVVMPGLRGPEVARRLSVDRPAVKVIFMSGYTEGAFDPEPGAEPEPDAAILQKPFHLDALARKIREVLEARTWR